MSDKFVLDAFAWVEYFVGSQKGEKVRSFIESGNSFTPTVVVAELSAKYSSEGKDFSNKLNFIKFNSRIEVLDEGAAELAGRLRTEQRKKKKDFGIIDSIIYATALTLKASLVTGDPHFDDIKEAIII